LTQPEVLDAVSRVFGFSTILFADQLVGDASDQADTLRPAIFTEFHRIVSRNADRTGVAQVEHYCAAMT
jgi:hypothetical protein